MRIDVAIAMLRSFHETLAQALREAERRGAEREREACASLALKARDLVVGGNEFAQGQMFMAVQLHTAIRNRPEPSHD